MPLSIAVVSKAFVIAIRKRGSSTPAQFRWVFKLFDPITIRNMRLGSLAVRYGLPAAVFFAVILAPNPEGLTEQGQRALAGMAVGISIGFLMLSGLFTNIQRFPVRDYDATIDESKLGSFLADNFDVVLRGLKLIPGDCDNEIDKLTN